MIDIAGAIASSMRADPDLGVEVFADVVPAGASGVFAVVRVADASRPFPDVSTWDTMSVLVDVVGLETDIPTLHAAAGRVRDHLHRMRGTVVSGISVQAVTPGTEVFGFDPTFTPPLPRWVLAAAMVVRSITPTPEGVVA